MNIGENLKEMRRKLKITQADLSKMAGIKQPTISAIENGVNNPAIETLMLLSEAMHCTVSDLIGQTNPAPVVDPDESFLLSIFHQLNPDGRRFLISQAESILAQPAFRKAGSMSSAI